jgi:hypothetical protein
LAFDFWHCCQQKGTKCFGITATLISGIAVSSVPPEVRAFLTGTAYNIGAGGIVLIGGVVEAFSMASLPYFVDGIEFASLAVFYSMFTWPRKVAVKQGSSN